jgi:DNA replication and repair protein RecF
VFLTKLNIHNFRNIIHKEYHFNNKINIFYGENGVGKTSILEAIHITSSGKSFRKSSIKSIINFEKDNLTVFIETLNKQTKNSFSISKHKTGKFKAKVNNSSVSKQSEITNQFPVISIDPEVYRLVDFGPLYRRNYLDWLVFHVKHDYIVLWKKVYKCIKQLNYLYKKKAPESEIVFWELNFITFSNELNDIRNNFFNQITPKINKLSTLIQKDLCDISINFKKGWSKDLSLQEQLNTDKNKNRLYGQLQHGPHKMDIQIKDGIHPASQTLSRGQKKTLSMIFYMAYIELLLENDIKPVLCLDDLDAELDSIKLKKVADFFINTGSQIFITSVLKEKIENAFPEAELFHVKHKDNLHITD